MRSAALVAVAVLALFLQPVPASAEPAPKACAGPGRASVATNFLLDACVGVDGVSVRNTLDVAVRVSASGAPGGPVPVSIEEGPVATVTRLALDGDGILLPGDVVGWPLGPEPVELTAVDVAPAPAAIASALETVLPDRGEPDALRPYASLIGDLLPAIRQRHDCLRGQNFLGRAACDVRTATAIGRAVPERLAGEAAVDVGRFVLDPVRWSRWSGLRTPKFRGTLLIPAAVPPAGLPPGDAAAGGTPLEQGGGPAVALPEQADGDPGPHPGSPSQGQAAPAPAQAPPPAAAPRPAPAPPSAPPPAPAPAPPRQGGQPPAPAPVEDHDEVEDDDGNGRGRGNDEGNGRGRGNDEGNGNGKGNGHDKGNGRKGD